MKTVSLEPANFEISVLYHRNVQSLNRLAQLIFNTLSNHFEKKERNRWRNFFSSSRNPIFMIFFQPLVTKLKQPTELILSIVLAAALNSTNLQNLIKCFHPCRDPGPRYAPFYDSHQKDSCFQT